MGYKTSSLLCLAIILAISSATNGLMDITSILDGYPQFSKFNHYLTETNLTHQINRRKTITILALDDGNMSSLEQKSLDTIEAILSVHVLLDYFDEDKLEAAVNDHTQITTLFQTSGIATYDQGFVYVAHLASGDFAFASAVKGSNYTSKVVKIVDTEPYTVSILQISQPILPRGLEFAVQTMPTPPPIAASPPAPEDDAESPDAESPDAAADGPDAAADSPDAAESPDAHSPTAAADQPDDQAGGVSRAHMELLGVVVITLASIFCSL